MIYTLQNARLTVSVDTRGAELVGVQLDGQERLWQNPDGSWDGHAPVLFPFCGRCAMKLHGRDYGVGFHGFASKQNFRVTEVSQTDILLSIEDSAQTFLQYPYHFAFSVHYTLQEAAITVQYLIENRTEQPMYFACGAHESYALPNGTGHYALSFAHNEVFSYQLHDRNGRLTGQTEEHGYGNLLPLENRTAEEGDTVILKDLRSRKLQLFSTDNGEPLAEVSFPDFANLLLWHVKDADYICIEPWQNLPDTAQQAADFCDKPGVQCLQPFQSTVVTHTIRYF